MGKCGLCHDLVKWDEGDARLAFEFTPEQVKWAAFLDQCESCLVILEGLQQSQTTEWSLERDVKIVLARCHGRRRSFQETLRLEIFFNDDRAKLELEYFSLQAHSYKSIIPRTSISGHPLSGQAIDWTLSLLEQCKRSHNTCRQDTRTLLPKRVVMLSSDGSSRITARLFEPINHRSPYIALSHCWGAHQNCITTRNSVAARKVGIPWKTIPKTFQEVMQLAMRLGFRFIWIDSLCIVQDDPEDWEVQSSLMSEIYQQAVLTIAATSSTGDNEGCCSRNEHRAPEVKVILPEHIKDCSIGVRKPLNHWDVQTANGLREHFPLLTRGWAFQERLLSPRVLHICESELVWECREESRCECGGLAQEQSPGGSYHHAVDNSQEEKQQHEIAQQELAERLETLRIERDGSACLRRAQTRNTWSEMEAPPAYDDVISPTRTNSSLSSASNPMPRPPTPDDDILAFAAQSNVPVYEDVTPVNEVDVKDCPDLVFHYHRIVEHYSALKLTRPSDRLPAFTGLCKRVQHLRNNYLAGLWSDSICYDLLWRVNTIDMETEDNGGRSRDYRGPTWSWVSAGSPVTYWSDIINFRVTYEGFASYVGESGSFYGFRAIEYTAAGRQADKIEMAVTVPGQNPFGAVTSAILTIEASATTATLRYTYDPHWLGGAGDHDPVRYKLELKTPFGDSENPIEIPFDADYSLGVDAPSLVPADAELTMLLIHPKVCMVLRPATRAVSPMVVNGVAAWERVGVARISDNLLNVFRIDWMHGSEVRKFHIV